MGMSCFLVQNRMHITKVSCFSVHFCSQLSPISCFVCKFVYICMILCVCGALGGRQFLRRVEVCMQFYTVFWEPFMGMSCFYGVWWHAGEVWLHFYRVCWNPFMEMSCFRVQKCIPGTIVSCFSDDFPSVLAPWGFERLCEALGGIGRLWEALGGFGRLCRLCKVLWGFGRLCWAVSESLREALGGFVT